MTTCFATITILLIFWLLTLIALYSSWKRSRERLLKGPNPSADLFLALATEKAKEAKESLKALRYLNEMVGIKILRYQGGKITPLVKDQEITLPPDQIEAVQKELEASPQAREITVNHRDEILLVRRIDAGARDAELVIIEDVTDSFNMAKRLKESERLAIFGKMSANMAHQLKTPLSVLAGRAQMLQRRLAGDKEACEICEEIFQEARDLAQRISEVVELYRHQQPVWENIDAVSILERTKDRLSMLNSSVEIHIRCPKELHLETDPRIVGNAIFLVAQNSMKPETAAKNLAISVEDGGDSVRIVVEDDGKGIPQEQRDQLFEPFQTGSGEGLGLGLFLAKDMVTRIGGDLVLENGGKGARFSLLLPKRPG